MDKIKLEILSVKSVRELIFNPTPENLRVLEYKICSQTCLSPEMDLWRLDHTESIGCTLQDVKNFTHDTPEFSVVTFFGYDGNTLAIWLNKDNWGWFNVITEEQEPPEGWEPEEDEDGDLDEGSWYDNADYDGAWQEMEEALSDAYDEDSLTELTILKFQQLPNEATGGYTAQPVGSECFPECDFHKYFSDNMDEAVEYFERILEDYAA